LPASSRDARAVGVAHVRDFYDTVKLGVIGESFALSFPAGTLDEVVKLEELCMVASWMKGLYKSPPFISPAFEAQCRAMNPACL